MSPLRAGRPRTGWIPRLAVAAALGAVILPAGAQAGESVTYQGGTGHDGLVDEPIAPPLAVRWSHALKGSISYPLVAGGRIFVTTATGDPGTVLHALDATSGTEQWSAPLPGSYHWSGLAYDAGRVFTVNADGRVAARAADTGAEQWSVQLSQTSFESSPTALAGLVFLEGGGSGGTLYALDQATGALRWNRTFGSGGGTSPASDGTRVFVSHTGPDVYAFDAATGAPAWHYQSGVAGGGGPAPVVHGGRVYVRDVFKPGEVLDAATGAKVGDFTSKLAPAFGGDLGVFNESGTFRGRDAAMTVRWSAAPASGGFVTAPFIAGAHVYAADGSGRLYAVERDTGRLAWSCAVGSVAAPDEQSVAQPLAGLGAGGGLLVVPTSGALVALAHDDASTCGAAAASPPGAPLAATAQPATSYGGVTRRGRGIGGTAVALRRDPDGRVVARATFGLSCRGGPFLNLVLYLRGLTAADGTFTATGTKRLTSRARLTATMTGTFSPTAATGSLRMATSRIRCESGARKFFVRLAAAPAGAAAKPAPDSVLGGVTTQAAGGVPLSVALRVTKDARKVSGAWQAVMRCGPRAIVSAGNVSPFTRVRGDGSFSDPETYTIRFPDGSRDRYRVTFKGRFLSDGAAGTLRIRMTTRKRGQRFYPCDSGVVRWTAAP